MILAGDVGGTKTLLGLFEPASPRPRLIDLRSYPTAGIDGIDLVVREFLSHHADANRRMLAASFGVAGPVVDGRAKLTNVPWVVDAGELATLLEIPQVGLLNDLRAMAHSVTVLGGDELAVLQSRDPDDQGNVALIAAGTGLGEAMLHRVDGRLIPSASEGGHGDFAARTDREAELAQMLRREHGRATYEDVISGRGLLNLHRFAHGGAACPVVPQPYDIRSTPPLISKAALERRCGACVEALDLFVSIYGAEAGNLALRALATGGIFVGGGIAPHILPALTGGRFLAAFRDKAPLEKLVAGVPVAVILNPQAGLLGAAVHASLGLNVS